MTNEQTSGFSAEQGDNPESVPTEELWGWIAQDLDTLHNSKKIIEENASDSEKGAQLTNLQKSYLAGESAAVARFVQRLEGKEAESQSTID